MKVYNKVASDFASLLDYNNYLEEVEDISECVANVDVMSLLWKSRYQYVLLI